MTPTPDSGSADNLATHHRETSIVLAEIAQHAYGWLRDAVHSEASLGRGTPYVECLVKHLSQCDQGGRYAATLQSARIFLESTALDVLTDPTVWAAAWVTDPWQDTFTRIEQDGGPFNVGTHRFQKTKAGYVFRVVSGRDRIEKLLPTGHETECVMEFLAAVWCGLFLLGIRADKLWSRVAHFALEDTSGYPAGVCLYKAYGDVYRIASRELQLVKSVTGGASLEAGDVAPKVRQLAMKPSLFGKEDIQLGQVNSQIDLNPYCFRQIGALYFVMFQIAYIRTGGPITILWAYRSADELSVVDSDETRAWLNHAFGDQYRADLGMADSTDSLALPAISADSDRLFIALPSTHLPTSVCPCALGVRHGVYSVLNDYQPTSSRSVPFSGRSVADDMFRSMVLAVEGLAASEVSQLGHAEAPVVDVLARVR